MKGLLKRNVYETPFRVKVHLEDSLIIPSWKDLLNQCFTFPLSKGTLSVCMARIPRMQSIRYQEMLCCLPKWQHDNRIMLQLPLYRRWEQPDPHLYKNPWLRTTVDNKGSCPRTAWIFCSYSADQMDAVVVHPDLAWHSCPTTRTP